MGKPHRDIETDHARRALDRVRRAHQRLNNRRIARAFELDQSLAERGGMCLCLASKEFVQRESTEITHDSDLANSADNFTASSTATSRSVPPISIGTMDLVQPSAA